MTYLKIHFTILICCVSLFTAAQTEKPVAEKKRHFTFYAGVGPNFYFNNLVIGKNGVNEFNYSFVGRIMWEPEYLLSLGVESGYNQLYTADYSKSQTAARITNVAIPIHLVISMKFLKNYYCNFSMGPSVLLNKVKVSSGGDFDASTVSLGDFGGAVGYRRLMNRKIFLGAELKAFYSSKLDDKNIALVVMAGYRF